MRLLHISPSSGTGQLAYVWVCAACFDGYFRAEESVPSNLNINSSLAAPSRNASVETDFKQIKEYVFFEIELPEGF